MYSLKLTDGDLAIRGDGNSVQLTGARRLEQEISCWLLEPVGSDTLYSKFGSTLWDKVGSPMLDEYIAEVRSEVVRVVNNYIEYQKNQVNADLLKGEAVFLSNWGDDDIIKRFDGVSVNVVADTLEVTVQLTTVAGSKVTVERTIY